MRGIGKYFIFLGNLLIKREPFKIYIKQIINECIKVGIDSIVIVTIVSTFIGAVTCIQTAYNLNFASDLYYRRFVCFSTLR